MSKQVDERVVSMQFDNRHFEQNVSTTMSTLDKLKQKLNFKDSGKSLEQLNSSASKVDLSTMGKAVDTVKAKFSALEVMGVTALANLTNSAVNAGKRIAAALTIQPIATGFDEYKLKLGSVRTIIASTGEDIETVTKYLNDLNRYSDETIYSFADMTRNIGKFTNAGVKLEDAVLAIKGISNEAAVSGATAEEASRAMYNFAQALSAGHVKLIDWKSIELANMATKEFKEQLIQAAVAAGTLTEAGDGMYKTLGGETLNATKNFNESLKDQWMTTEVLISTLRDYADETTEIGKKAKDAATKVSNFSQMFDVLKESAQSGWAQTWEIIFGDLHTAEKLFTPLTKTLGGFIDKMSDFRNTLLAGAFGKPKIFTQIEDSLKSILAPINKANAAIETVVDTMQDYEDVVDRIIRGEFKNAPERFQLLTEAGYDWAHAQNLVNEKLGCSKRYATTYAEGQNGVKKANEKSTEATEKLTEAQINQLDALTKLTDAQLKAKGYSDPQIKAIRTLQREADRLGMTVKEFLSQLDELNGRTILIKAFSNVGQGLTKVLGAIKDAWVEIFPPMTSRQLYNIIAGFHKLTTHMRVSDETADKVRRTFRGLFAILDIILTLISGPIGFAFRTLRKILAYFNVDILSATAYVGDMIVALRDFIDKTLDIGKILERFIPNIRGMTEAFKEWIKGLKEADNIPKYIIDGLVNGLLAGISTVCGVVKEVVTALIEKAKELLGIHSPSVVFFAIGGFLMAGLVAGILDGKVDLMDSLGTISTDILEFVKTSFTKIVEFFKELNFGHIMAIGTVAGLFITINKLIGPLQSLGDAFEDFGYAARALGKAIKANTWEKRSRAVLGFAISIGILAAALYTLGKMKWVDIWTGIAAIGLLAVVVVGLAAASSKIEGKDGSLGKFSFALLEMSAAMWVMSKALSTIATMGKRRDDAFAVMVGFAIILVTITGMTNYVKEDSVAKLGKSLLAISGAFLIMAYVVKIIGGIRENVLKKGYQVLIAFTLIIAGLIFATNLAGNNVEHIGKTIVGIAVAMGVLALVVKMLGTMKVEDLMQGLAAVTYLSFVISGLIWATRLVGSNIKRIASTMLGIAGAIGMLAIVAWMCGSMDPGTLVQGLAAVTAFSLIIVGLIAAVKMLGKDAPKIAGTIGMLGVGIMALAFATILLGFIDVNALTQGLIAVGLLSIMIGALIYVTKNAKDCMKNIVAIGATLTMLAIALVVLSFIDPKKLTPAVIAIATVMGMFALILKSASDIQSSIGPLIVLTVAIAAIATAIYILAAIPDPNQAVTVAIGMSIVMGAMAGLFWLVSKIGDVGAKALVGIVGLTTMCALLVVFGLSLALLPPLDNKVTTIMILATVMTLFTLLLLPLTLIGALIYPALIGVVALTAMIVPMTVFCLALNAFPPLEDNIKTIEILMDIMTRLTGLLLQLAIVAPLVAMAVVALTGLSALMVVMFGFVATVGALNELTEGGVAEFVNGGVDILIKLADGLGRMIAAFAAGVLSTLPQIGTMLSQFMSNAQPFITGAKLVDDAVIKGTGCMVAAILALSVASLLQAITSLIPFAPSFGELGSMLSEFIAGADTFIQNAPNINPAAALGAKYLAEAMLTLGGAQIMQSIANFIGGEDTMEQFATGMPKVGEALVSFAKSMSELDDTQLEGVAKGAEAIKLLAEAASDIPNSGGLWADIFGDNGLAAFGEEMEKVGTNLANFVKNIGTFGEAQKNTVKFASEAITLMADAADDIPNEGGLWADIFGDNGLAKFGENMEKVGTNLCNFVGEVSGIKDSKSVQIATGMVSDFAKAAQTLGDTDCVDALVELAEQIPELGENLQGTYESFEGVGKGTYDRVQFGIKILKAFMGLKEGIPSEEQIDNLVYLSEVIGDDIGDNMQDTYDNFEGIGAGTLGRAKDVAKVLQVFMDLKDKIPSETQLDNLVELSEIIGDDIGDNMRDTYDSLEGIGAGTLERAKSVKEVITVFTDLAKNAPDAAKLDVLNNFATSVGNVVKNLNSIPAAVSTITSTDLANTVSTLVTSIESAANSGVTAFKDTFVDQVNIDNAKTSITSFVSSASTAASATDIINDFKSAGFSCAEGFANGMTQQSAMDKVAAAGTKIGNHAYTKAKEAIDSNSPSKKFAELGLFSVLGYAQGVTKNIKDAVTPVRDMGKAIISGFEDEMEIHSPSLKMEKDGHYVVQGVAEGINADTSAEEAMRIKAQNIAKAFQDELDKLSRSGSLAEKVLKLWGLTDGKKATDEERESKQLEYLKGDMERSSREQALAYDKWQEIKRYAEKGEVEQKEVDAAYEAWYDAQIKAVESANNYNYLLNNGALDRRYDALSQGQEVRDKHLESWEKEFGDKVSTSERNARQMEHHMMDITSLQEQLTIAQKRHSDAIRDYGGESQQAYEEWLNVVAVENQILDAKKQVEDIALSGHELDIAALDEAMERRADETELWSLTDGRNVSAEKADARERKDAKANMKDIKKQMELERKHYRDLLKKDYKEESDIVKESLEKILDYEIAYATEKNKILDLEEEALERKRESYELASETVDLEYQLWESTTGRNATSAEKDMAKIGMLTKQLASQSSLLDMSRKEYQEACKDYGKASNEAQAAYQEYLNQQLEVANLQNDIADINDKIVTKQKLAKNDYKDYVEKYKKFYSVNGMSMEQLEKDAKLVSGYDPNTTVDSMITKTQGKLDELTSSSEYTKLLDSFTSVGTSYISSINDGVTDGIDSMLISLESMLDDCEKSLGERVDEWKTCGVNLVTGFINGITDNIQKAVDAAKKLANETEAAVRTELDEHSPSRVFADIGSMAVLGLAKGFTDTSYVSAEAAANLGKSAIDSLRGTIARMSELIDSEMDTNPTIAPVLDLTDVKDGFATLNAMLTRDNAMDINTNISARRNAANANTDTSDTKTGNTYNFNQYNNSPKALSRQEIYRQTKNQFAALKGATS